MSLHAIAFHSNAHMCIDPGAWQRRNHGRWWKSSALKSIPRYTPTHLDANEAAARCGARLDGIHLLHRVMDTYTRQKKCVRSVGKFLSWCSGFFRSYVVRVWSRATRKMTGTATWHAVPLSYGGTTYGGDLPYRGEREDEAFGRYGPGR